MISLFKPYMPNIDDIKEVLNSGKLTYGEYTKQFEEELKEYFNEPYLLVTNSFHSAISVALMAMNIGYGDEIIASPMACLASTQPYLTNGITLRWADIDPRKGTLCPESVMKNITKNTKAIVHNHFCGYPGYIDEVNSIGKKYGIPIIDDGIECFGSEYKGMKIGACGTDVTLFSLTAVRIPNCIDGGILIFKNKEYYERGILIRDCGIDRSRFRDLRGEINPECDVELVGYSATMSNVNGYIGLQQMKDIHNLLMKKREIALKWDEFFKKSDIGTPIPTDNSVPNYWVYGFLTDNKENSIDYFKKMGYQASSVHMRNDVYSVFGSINQNLKGVDYFGKRFLAVPCGWWMNVNENLKL